MTAFRHNAAPDDELELLLQGIREGNEQSLVKFWDLHYRQLTVLARRKMGNVRLRTHDEEDFALSAIHSFYKGLAERRFDGVRNNSELWKLLATIVIRKITKQRKKQLTQKRGRGQVRGESVFSNDANDNTDDRRVGLGNIPAKDHSPCLEADFIDTCEYLFEMLDDETTRNIAKLSMEGHSVDAIAEMLGCVRRTVERKLKKIREKWASEEMK